MHIIATQERKLSGDGLIAEVKEHILHARTLEEIIQLLPRVPKGEVQMAYAKAYALLTQLRWHLPPEARAQWAAAALNKIAMENLSSEDIDRLKLAMNALKEIQKDPSVRATVETPDWDKIKKIGGDVDIGGIIDVEGS